MLDRLFILSVIKCIYVRKFHQPSVSRLSRKCRSLDVSCYKDSFTFFYISYSVTSFKTYSGFVKSMEDSRNGEVCYVGPASYGPQKN
jgi:hypothetical protein